MYAGKDYDLAGFAVGAAERDSILPRLDVAAGDVILGLASSGVHSNGYSLVRRIVEKADCRTSDDAPFAARHDAGRGAADPDPDLCEAALAAVRAGTVKALAHITGGGLTETSPACCRRAGRGAGRPLAAACRCSAGWRSSAAISRRRSGPHLQLRHRHGRHRGARQGG